MIAAVAFCPQAPALVRPLSGAAAVELDDARGACRRAIRAAVTPVRRVVLLAAAPVAARFDAGASGSLAGFGPPLTVTLGAASPPAHVEGSPAVLPPALTVAAWLLADAGVAHGREHAVTAIAVDENGDDVPAVPDLVTDEPVAVVVAGDGSARRTVKSPGYLDDRALPFDATVQAALSTGDAESLARLDPATGRELLAAGVPAWRTLAAACGGAIDDAELWWAGAPLGVGYFVASWSARPAGTP